MAGPQLTTAVRESLLKALDAGLAMDDAVALFGVSVRTIYRWRERKYLTGSAGPAPGRGARPRICGELETTLREVMAAHPDATLPELCSWFAERADVRVGPSAMCRRLQALGFTRKKRPSSPGSATRSSAPPGEQPMPILIPPNSCSSMKPIPQRR